VVIVAITAIATLGMTVNTSVDTGTETPEPIMADTLISLGAVDIRTGIIIGIGLISPTTDTGGHINDPRTFGGTTRSFEEIRFSLTKRKGFQSGPGSLKHLFDVEEKHDPG
jgi:hypothetical protein